MVKQHRWTLRRAGAALLAAALSAAAPWAASAQEATGEAAPDDDARREEAQRDAAEARKLLKLQRGADAIPLLERAYLVLEDPELLRLLGEAWLIQGDTTRALALWDAYLEDPQVGESAKDLLRARRAEVAPKPAGGGEEGEDGEDGDDDTLGLSAWSTGGAGSGQAGRPVLLLAGGLVYNVGASYDVAIPASDGGAATRATGDYTHGGVGVRLGGGIWATDALRLTLSVGNTWMSWETQAPITPFSTATYAGLRPELWLDAGYRLGAGVSVEVGLGGDAVLLTDVPDGVADGLYGYRALTGLGVRYAAPLAGPLDIEAALGLRVAPFLHEAQPLPPGFTDLSWVLALEVGVAWSIGP